MTYTAYITITGETGKKGFKMTIEADSEQEAMKILRSKISVKLVPDKQDNPFDGDILEFLNGFNKKT